MLEKLICCDVRGRIEYQKNVSGGELGGQRLARGYLTVRWR